MTIADFPDVMIEDEAAEFLRVSPKTLQDWRCRGGGPRYSKAGGIKYRKSVLLAWLEAREQLTTSDRRKPAEVLAHD